MSTPWETAWILSVGSELTLGQSVDTNSAWLAQRLAGHGIRTRRHVTVADERPEIIAAIRQAVTAADLVLITGGLGPTADDLTREALAEASGDQLILHQPSLDSLVAFFENRARPLPEANRVQALIPSRGTALPNTCGTAPGILTIIEGRPVFALPGVPAEMRAMFEQQVVPRLLAFSGGEPSTTPGQADDSGPYRPTPSRTVIQARRLNCFGLGEADLGERIRDLMQRGRNPEVGTTAEHGVIGIRINCTACDRAAAERALDETEAELRRRLGTLIFGRESESLAEVVGHMLAARGATLAVAESCTGGLVSKELTDLPGSSHYFLGGVVAYSNQAKQDLLGVPGNLLELHGAVSAAVAEALAAGVRVRFESDWGLSVTGIAGPDGGTPGKPVGLVYLGLATRTGARAQELRLGSEAGRAAIRLRAGRSALNWLRLELLGANRENARS